MLHGKMAKRPETIVTCVVLGLVSLISFTHVNASFPYYGIKIGALKRLHHGVSGDVYAVDSRTIFIKSFNYDGEAPAAYFYVGNTNRPSNEGAHRLRDERGGTASLTRRYRNADITLSLPDGKTLRDIKWFSVWCDEFAVNFGDVVIPNSLDFPRPQKVAALKGVHGVSSDSVVIVDAQTLLVPNFSYDGEAPDAKFWVGRGQKPTAQGLRIPDENGKEDALRRYDRKTIVLTLPGDLTIFDIGHFGVWCEAFAVDFGHVKVPDGLNVPPSLKMLGISPQSKLNCEVLYDDLAFEVRWAVAGESIVVQLVAKLAKHEYMSFGISPSRDRSMMIGSDVVVAWVDKESGKGFAQDYYLDGKSQCSGGRGTCPDVNILENTNSIRLLNAAMVNGYSIVTYQRSLQATDRLDLPIVVNGTFEAIVWAIGPLNERKEASFHTQFTKHTHYIDFGRQPTWNCPMPEGSKSSALSPSEKNAESDGDHRDTLVDGYPPARSTVAEKDREPEDEFYENRAQALQRPNRRPEARPIERPSSVVTPKPVSSNGSWDIPAIQCHEPEDGVFYAQMGPTGGKHGYPAITGHVGWGISWYINGLLIPEIHVVRGKAYTFVVEGGNNADIPAKYHPFYITDDPIGGYEHKRDEEKKAVRIFAGVHRSRSGQITPTGVGRLCNWTPDVDGPPADDYQSFGAYQRTLTLKCDPGEPGVITWKPDKNTPDTVYYHCFTHRYLGWKIHVHDSCDDARFSTSEKQEIRVPANIEREDINAASSIRHETKVSPNDNFLLKHQTDLIKNHNMNGTPPKLTFEITKSSEITKLISDGIRAAEALEESILRNSNGKNNIENVVPTPGDPHSRYKQQPLHNSQTTTNKKKSTALFGDASIQGLPHSARIPPKPYIPTAAPEILSGEMNKHKNNQIIHNHHIQTQTQHYLHSQLQYPHSHPHGILNALTLHLHHPHANNQTNLLVQAHKTIGLSEYLRPPQNAPLFQPVKLPGRRPYPVPAKKLGPSKQVLPQQLPRHPSKHPQQNAPISQSSLIVNHYRKPVPGLLKPFLKEKHFPIQPIAASVLLLGQPTQLGGQRKTEPHLLSKKPKPKITVPYSDLVPQDTLQTNVLTLNSYSKKEKKPVYVIKSPNHVADKVQHVSLSPINEPPATFKKPFDIHEVHEKPISPEIATMKPAVNNGFKPNTVVVESGFRPIIRHDGIQPKGVGDVGQLAHRREDPGSEIDEAMETDTLFLTAPKGTQTQTFEPMFIPSPPDSTNTTIINRKPIASPLVLPSSKETDESSVLVPIAGKIQNSTEEDMPMPEGTIDENLPTDEETATIMDNESEENRLLLEKRIAIHESDLADLFDDEFMDEFRDEENESKAQAAERIDTYYLQPENRNISPLANIQSGAVITYDGKSVIDSSLVLPSKLEGSDLSNSKGLSNIERTTPQFQSFRGEFPPEVNESTERLLKFAVNPVTEYSNPILTKIRDGSPISSSSKPLLTASSTSSIQQPSIFSTSRPISTNLHIQLNST